MPRDMRPGAVRQGIASYRVADHLLVGFLLGAKRNEASLAKGSADHRLVEFRLGAMRCEASPALGMVDHPLMEFESWQRSILLACA